MDANSESAERARRENAMIRRLDRIREEKRRADIQRARCARRARREQRALAGCSFGGKLFPSDSEEEADEWGE